MTDTLITNLKEGENVQLVTESGQVIDYPYLNPMIGRFNGNMHSSSGNNTVWYLKVGIDPSKKFIIYRLNSTSRDHISTTITLHIEPHPDDPHSLSVTREDIKLNAHQMQLSHIPSFASSACHLLLEAKEIGEDGKDQLQQVITYTFTDNQSISIVCSNYQDGLLCHTDCGVLYQCDRNSPPHFDVVVHDRVNSPRIEELE